MVAFAVSDTSSGGSGLDLGISQVAITATPTTVKKGESTRLTWKTKDASSCSAAGAWSGTLSTEESSRIMTLPKSAGTHEYTVRCQNSRVVYSASVTVVVE